MNITKEQFNAYREVQFSGVTNMFAVNAVMSLSGLTKEQCLYSMKNYGKLEDEYGNYKK